MVTSPTLDQIRNFEGKYPKQLWYLFATEMWERFCFYGMRGMLTVFMVTRLGLDDKTANLQYGAIQAFVYAFTFIGGVFADKILGFQKSLFWGATLMIAGGLVIAFAPEQLFYIGTSFSIIGTGFFKPNISTMVGALYHENDSRRDAGFSLFYAGINFGALLGGILMVYVGKYHSWSLAFGLVSIVMTISLINFALTRKSLGPIGLSPLAAAGVAPSPPAHPGDRHVHRLTHRDPDHPAVGHQHGLYGLLHVHHRTVDIGLHGLGDAALQRHREQAAAGCLGVHPVLYPVLGLLRTEWWLPEPVRAQQPPTFLARNADGPQRGEQRVQLALRHHFRRPTGHPVGLAEQAQTGTQFRGEVRPRLPPSSPCFLCVLRHHLLHGR